jgi:hypothetical protein
VVISKTQFLKTQFLKSHSQTALNVFVMYLSYAYVLMIIGLFTKKKKKTYSDTKKKGENEEL